MSWSTIRPATAEDHARLQAATDRFQARHNLSDEEMGAVQHNSDGWPFEHRPEERTRLHHLYRKCVQRALRSPDADGIACEYVGFEVK